MAHEVRAAVLAERARIVATLRSEADGYRAVTRGVLLELALQVERADHEVVCQQCGVLRSEVERSQSARRPISCEVLDYEGSGPCVWSRHRFAAPVSGLS